MAEMSQYEERIIYLATVFRSKISEKDHVTPENPPETHKRKQNRQQSKEKLLSEILELVDDDEDEDEDEDMEEGMQLPEMCEADLTEWNKAFSKLLPPPKVTRRRQLHGGINLTNKSCQEILQVVWSYKENLESEKEYQQNKGNKKGKNGSASHLWHKDNVGAVHDSDGAEYLEQIYSTRDCGETPIPRNLTRF